MDYSSQLIFDGAERRQAIIDAFRSARKSLILSIFRCDDFGLLDEVTGAVRRGVAVKVLISPDARGWKKRLQRLAELLQSAGAELFRYAGPSTKYHAKYVVADDALALISSSNLTHKCFERTCDFLFIGRDRELINGLQSLFGHDCNNPGDPLPSVCPQLIIGPDTTRERFSSLLGSAGNTISIMDHRVTDAGMIELLEAKKRSGVNVKILGRGDIAGRMSHGKMMVIDDRSAVVGSVALSRPSLDSRRELSVLIEERDRVTELCRFFDYCADRHVGHSAMTSDQEEDDDDDE